jgi:hemolysin III
MRAADMGPIYRETDFSHFPVDAWSTWSNIAFLLIFGFWMYRIAPSMRRHRFLALCLPLLLAGYVGGTMYHATRSHVGWMLLDTLSIMALCLCAAVHFWRRVRVGWAALTGAVAGPIVFMGLLRLLVKPLAVPREVEMGLGYLAVAIPIMMPITVRAGRRPLTDRLLVLGAIASFMTALLMRYIDFHLTTPLLPMGTHWLWHLFGAVATHLLIWFTFRDDLVDEDTKSGGEDQERNDAKR